MRPLILCLLSLGRPGGRERLRWCLRCGLEQALEALVAWHLAHRDGAEMPTAALQQIEEFSSS